jgi:hypothetical protein
LVLPQSLVTSNVWSEFVDTSWNTLLMLLFPSPITPTLTMLEHRIGPTVWCMGSPREKYFLLTACRLHEERLMLCNKNDSRYLSHHHVTMRISAVLHKVSY